MAALIVQLYIPSGLKISSGLTAEMRKSQAIAAASAPSSDDRVDPPRATTAGPLPAGGEQPSFGCGGRSAKSVCRRARGLWPDAARRR